MRRAALIGALLFVLVPLAQSVIERFGSLPVGPARWLVLGVCTLALVPVSIFAVERWRGPLSGAARLAVGAGVPALLLADFVFLVSLSGSPWGPLPGGALSGTVSNERHPDWSATDHRKYVQLQLDSEDPRSIEILSVRDGADLYVGANYPETKRWPHDVRRDPAVIVRVGDTLYPRTARPVEDPDESRRLLEAMNAKYGFDVSLGTGVVWFYRLAPREVHARTES